MSTSTGTRYHGARIPLAGPLSIFLLGGVLGLLASYDPAVSMPWLLWLGAGTALYIAIILLARSPARLGWGAAPPVLAAALGAVVLATQYRYLGYEQKFGVVAQLGMRSSAPFPPLGILSMSANAVASCLEGALPLTIGLAVARQGLRRLAWAICAMSIAYGILLTSSRGAWVALAIAGLLGAGVVLRSTERWRRAQAWVLGLLGLAAIAGIGLLLVIAPSWHRVLAAAEYRAADRLTLYRNSFFLALDFAVSGIGPGATFGMVYSRFQLLIPSFYLSYSHNLFLSIWLAQGLLGLLGFGGLLWASSRLVWRGLVRTGAGAAAPIGWGAALGCTVTLLHGLTDAPQYGSTGYALLMSFALFSVMVAAAWLADSRPLAWVRLGRVGTPVAVVLAVGTLWAAGRPILSLASANVAAIYEARSLLADRLADDERAALHREAIAWADRGLRFESGSRAALKERGMLALALSERDFDLAIRLLVPALYRSPADQSIRKGLGYAYIWQGRVEEGVALLRRVDRTGEIAGELQVWPYAWRDRGRPDLASQAERAAKLMVSQGQ